MSIRSWSVFSVVSTVSATLAVLYSPPSLSWLWCPLAIIAMFSITITGGKIADSIDERNE